MSRRRRGRAAVSRSGLLCRAAVAAAVVVSRASSSSNTASGRAAAPASSSAPPLPWSCSAGAVTLSVAADGAYSVAVSGAPWLTGGDAVVHWGGARGGPWLSRVGGGLVLAGPGAASSGADAALGAFVALRLAWAAANASSPLPFAFTTAFTCFPDAELVLFAQEYPDGVGAGVDVGTYVEGVPPPGGTFDNFNISFLPTAHFPSFDAGAGTAAARLGYIEWAGEFSWHLNSYGVGVGSNATGSGGTGAGAGGYVGGQLGGPLVLHEPAAPRESAVALGPLGDFKDVMLALVKGDGWARLLFGPQGHLTALPRGFAARLALAAPAGGAAGAGPPPRTAVFPGEAGVTAAVYAYGAALRLVHNTTRFAPEDDIGVSMLSTWTDNGAVYDGDYWDQKDIPNKGAAGETFLALAAAQRAAGVPSMSLQLDPYWFARGYPGNGNWTASPEVWGARSFDDMIAGGVRPTLYSFFWAVGKANTFTQYKWVDGWADTFVSGSVGRVAPEDARAFYAELFRRCRLWACVGFEIDFLDFIYFALPDALLTAGVHEEYLAGVSSAAVAARVPVQLCMPLASDVLATVRLPGVSNVRASDDNDLTYAPGSRWKIGLTSLLHGAVGVRPFFDATWTHAEYAGAEGADVPYPAGYAQNATELGVVVSTLSTGPVGLGDKAGFTNATLARVACASNGVLLKPSLPAAPVDAYFRVAPGEVPPTPAQAAGTEVWAAPSFIDLTYAPAAASAGGRVGGGDAGAWWAPALAAAPAPATAARARYEAAAAAAGAGALRHPRGLHRFVLAAAARDGDGASASSASSASSAPPAALVAPVPPATPCPWVSLLVVDAPPALGLVVRPADVTPSLVTTAGAPGAAACAAAGLATAYVALPWAAGAAALDARCADGAPAAGCVRPFSDADGASVATGVAPNQGTRGAPHPFELLSLAPVLPSGWALLGELAKATRASPTRFPAVAATGAPGGQGARAPVLTFLLAGAADETVDVALLAPRGAAPAAAVLRVRARFGPAGGLATVACAAPPTGGAATCNVTGAVAVQ